MIRVQYFAAAAEAAGAESGEFEASTLGQLRERMLTAHGGEFDRVLTRCSILVNGVRTDEDAAALAESDSVHVLPPFAGG